MDADDEMRSEYDLSKLKGGVRGKYFDRVSPRESANGTVRLTVWTIAIVSLLLLAFWMTTLADMPQIWAPCNLVVLVPAFLLNEYFSSTSICLMLAAFFVPTFFLIWTIPATWRDPAPPKRTVLLTLVTVALSATSIFFGYSYGIEYQGSRYVYGVEIVSMVCWTAILVLLSIALWKRRQGWNIAFHVFFFAWLAWYAIPYMGELP